MHLPRKLLSIILHIFLGALAAIAVMAEFHTWSVAAWRLFSTWVMLGISLYALGCAFWLGMHYRSPSSPQSQPAGNFAPRLAGLLATNALLILVVNCISWSVELGLPQSAHGFGQILVNYLVPLLMLAIWFGFTPQGNLRPVEPLYYLAPIVLYCALIIITADSASNAEILRYPYPFFNYQVYGLETLMFALLDLAALTTVLGFVVFACDFVLSGRLSRYVVLPKVKTIVIVDAPKPDIALSAAPGGNAASSGRSKRRTVNDVVRIVPQSGSKAKKSRPSQKAGSAAPDSGKETNRKQPASADGVATSAPKADPKAPAPARPKSRSKSRSKSHADHASPAQSTASPSPTSKPDTSKSKKQQKLANVGKLQPILDLEDKSKDSAPKSKSKKALGDKKSSNSTRLEKGSSNKDNSHQQTATKTTPLKSDDTKSDQTADKSRKSSEFQIPRNKSSDAAVSADSTSDSKKTPSKSSSSKDAAHSSNSKANHASSEREPASGQSKSEFHLPGYAAANAKSDPPKDSSAKKDGKTPPKDPKKAIRHF